MSWQNELYHVYECCCGQEDSGNVLLPVSHSTANAQIQITVKEDGTFVDASQINKTEAVTVIPVTEDSGARSSGICPMPFADKLVYIAGDYGKYATGKRADNSKYFAAYMEQLEKWCKSEFSHPAVKAVYTYLSKAEIMYDLIMSGVLQTDAASGKLADKVSIAGIAQEDAFVRFCVNYDDLEHTKNTWQDKSLYESFISYNKSVMGNVQLCYATGRMLPVTYKHPSKIRNSGDKAKLISSNDESGFTYRGRFSKKEEAISVSYEFSQKMHNALKWLISRQGMHFDTMEVVIWESCMTELPDIRSAISDYDEFDEEESVISSPQYAAIVQKIIFGYSSKLTPDAKVMVLGVDAATTGRLSIAMYSELTGSRFYENLEKWHTDTAVMRYSAKKKGVGINSFSVYDIAKCAYGTEQGKSIEADKKILSKTILRLLPCITEGKKLPVDIVMNLVHKASNPMAYEEKYNYSIVLETACGMIKKMNIDNNGKKKGVISMAYDPEEKSRSYLYGCLLAVADKTERDIYKAEKENLNRVTNARRYWHAFSARPAQTWKIIEERLVPYLNKAGAKSTDYAKKVQEITDKMTREDFIDNSALEPDYLLGYHHYTSYLYGKNNKEE